MIFRPQQRLPDDRWLGFLRFLTGLAFTAGWVLIYVDGWYHQPAGAVLWSTLLFGRAAMDRVDQDDARSPKMDHRTEVALVPWTLAVGVLLLLLYAACWWHYPTDVGVILAALLWCLMEMVLT